MWRGGRGTGQEAPAAAQTEGDGRSAEEPTAEMHPWADVGFTLEAELLGLTRGCRRGSKESH